MSDVLLLARELRCFHSKLRYDETMLGLGVTLEHYESGELANIYVSLDPIRYCALYAYNY